MAGIDRPPRNGQFGKESDWERSEILGDLDDMDTELAALVEKAEHASEVRDNVAFWINNMLKKHRLPS